jgi:hypothetical protein
MFRSSQKLFSASLIAVLFVFLFIAPSTARACAEEPQTLLSLYLQSDLIILADYESNRIINQEEESEYGSWVEIGHHLRVVKILKGPAGLETVSFSNHEFRPAPNTEPTVEEPSEEYHPLDGSYVDMAKIRSGEQHLYFLTKIEDTNSYGLADYASAVKDVRGKFEIYETTINDLNEISASKENQLERLAEWLVKAIEEPETRDDAISDLTQSFYNYDEEIEGAETPVQTFDENFSIYSSKIDKVLTESQKSRISSVLYQLLSESWFAPEPEYANYGIAFILKTFDRSRAAVYSYNMYRNIDKSDAERKKMVMGFLTEVVEDEGLRDIYYSLMDIDYESETKEAQTAEELKAEAELKANLLKNFDERFEVMMARNFQPFEAQG